MKVLGGLLCFIGFVCGIIGLFFLYLTFFAMYSYRNAEMGNEARGYTSGFGGISFICIIACMILCFLGWKLVNKDFKEQED
jgi:hypothetical protein